MSFLPCVAVDLVLLRPSRKQLDAPLRHHCGSVAQRGLLYGYVEQVASFQATNGLRLPKILGTPFRFRQLTGNDTFHHNGKEAVSQDDPSSFASLSQYFTTPLFQAPEAVVRRLTGGDFRRVSVKYRHTCGVKTDGSVAWPAGVGINTDKPRRRREACSLGWRCSLNHTSGDVISCANSPSGRTCSTGT